MQPVLLLAVAMVCIIMEFICTVKENEIGSNLCKLISLTSIVIYLALEY